MELLKYKNSVNDFKYLRQLATLRKFYYAQIGNRKNMYLSITEKNYYI